MPSKDTHAEHSYIVLALHFLFIASNKEQNKKKKKKWFNQNKAVQTQPVFRQVMAVVYCCIFVFQ